MKVYDGSAWNIAAISSASPTFTGTVTADGLSLGDNDKATFGAGNDLEIYYDGSNSYILNTAPYMLIESGTIVLRNTAGTEDYAKFNENSDVTLYFNNNLKFATTNTGIDVTGTATMDGLTVDGVGVISNTNAAATGGYLWLKNLDATTSTKTALLFTNTTNTAFESGRIELNRTVSGQDFNFYGNGNKILTASSNGDISFYEDTGTTPKFFWDASTERLGLGTSSPQKPLQIFGSVGVDAGVSFTNAISGSTATDGLLVTLNSDGTNATIWNYENGYMRFATNSTERLRIDASGNLLVGKTSDNFTIEGFSVRQNAAAAAANVTMTRDSAHALAVNRLTNDGDLVKFYKDGTAVGSIGIESNGFYIDGESAHAGIKFTGNAVIPRDNGVDVDGLNDIGASAGRWKDLYLSGGVYLGGTGAANQLDDYEEGTWTPAYTPTTGTFTTITTASTGRYTKVGRLVTVFASVRTSGTLDVTGASGNLAITELPFVCNATLAGGGADTSHQLWNLGTDILNTRMSVAAGSSQILMYKNTMNTTSFPTANITVADMSTVGGSFNNLIAFTVSYEV
jgi:hypothetical protein